MAKGKRHTATAFVTGGSGGVGKSFTARALAQALGSHGYVTLLVDGNPGQQSQRAFLGVDWSRGIEDVGISGAMSSVLRPREVKAAFGFLPGPMAPQDPDLLDRYGDALVRLEGSCDFIIVDSDRLDGTQWDDPDTFAGGLIRPLVEKAGARLVFRVGQSGSQLDDGMAALSAVGMPERTIVAAQCAGGRKPRPDRQWRDMLDGLAAYAGTDVWTGESARIVDTGLRGFEPDSEPDWLVRTAVWLGADRSRFRKERKGGLWGRRTR